MIRRSLLRFGPVLLAMSWTLTLSATAQQLSAPAELSTRQLLADMLLRHSLQAVSTAGPDGLLPDQYLQAELLLNAAVELDPQDGGLWELKAHLARSTGNPQDLIDALDRYLEIDPDADAYRLEQIFTRLTEVDTLDGRLAMLERELENQDDDAHSDPLRSRLASSAAAMSLELGDDQKFLNHLKTAVRSDPANSDAAWLTYDLAVRREAQPRQLAAAAINLVRAAPIDSDARVRLADALSGVALYEQAARQYNVAASLERRTPMGEETLTNWARCLIGSGETAQAAEMLDRLESIYASDEQTPRPVPIEWLLQRRILHGDTDRGQEAYRQVVGRLSDAAVQGDSDAKLELAWIKALFGEDTDEVTPLLEGQDQNDVRYQRATGFVFMRDGADRWARRTFESIADSDSISAYGLAQLQGRDDAGRARFLRDVLQQFPSRIGALLAADQLHQMNREVVAGPDGQAIAAAMSRLPTTLWRLDVDRNPWLTIRAQFGRARSTFLQPINADLILSNALEIPLSFNPNAAIDGTSIVSISAFNGGQLIGQMPPIVLPRVPRLTIPARGRLTIPARLDRSIFGLMLAKSAPNAINYNAAFTFGPRFSEDGGMQLGPLGGIDSVRSLQAFVPVANEESMQQWMTEARESRDSAQYIALALLARSTGFSDSDTVSRQIERDVYQTINETYGRLDAMGRAWVWLFTPAQTSRRSPLQPMIDAAAGDDDPLVQMSYLLSQATTPDHPELARLARDGTASVQRFAEALQRSLRQSANPQPTQR